MMMTPTRDPSAPRAALLSAAAIATAAILGFVVVLFNSAGSMPWLPADQDAAIAHCDAALHTTQRVACLLAATTPHPTRVAAR